MVIFEEEHIGSFKDTKNVLTDGSYLGVYSSECIFHNKKFFEKRHLVALLSVCLVSLLPLPWVNVLHISPGPRYISVIFPLPRYISVVTLRRNMNLYRITNSFHFVPIGSFMKLAALYILKFTVF